MQNSTWSDSTLSAPIKLDQFLKLQGVAQTGGEAKIMIKQGLVEVNGEPELRRGRKLVTGDRVTVASQTYEVNIN
ncbi:MAG: RNA-binding S4 domain-containing protein [Cyanobacteria bacterium J06621_8]